MLSIQEKFYPWLSRVDSIRASIFVKLCKGSIYAVYVYSLKTLYFLSTVKFSQTFFSRGRYEFEEQPVKKRTSDIKVCEGGIVTGYIRLQRF